MDTREKIVAPGTEIRRRGRVRALVAHFDPVFAAHVRRIREIAHESDTLVVILTDPPAPFLTNRARAELAAALSAVDYVIPATDNAVEDILGRLAADEVIREEAADRERSQSLSAHVRERQNAR